MDHDDADYQRNFESTPINGSIIPHILLFVVQMVALSTPPFPHRKVLFSSAILVLAVVANFSQFTDDPGLGQFFSLAWPHYLSVLEKLIFSVYPGPEATLWRVDRPVQEALNLRSFGPHKLIWAFVIWFNLRGIRWNYQVQNIPTDPMAQRGRWSFILHRLLTFARLLLMADLFTQLAAHNFYATDAHGGAVNSRMLTTRHPNFTCQLYRTAIVGVIPYTFMNLQYVAGAIVWVLLGISQPEDWPPFFGSIVNVTTVRAFWGQFWHQMIRRTVNVYTGAFCDMIKLQPGTIHRYTRLWLSFAISGVMHATSTYIIPAPLNLSFSDRSLGFFQFFLLQAAAITAEDVVLWLYPRIAPTSTHRWRFQWVGYAWVICWFGYSLPFFLDIFLKMKNVEKPMLPFTLLKPAVPFLAMCT
ncbi:hypothetical protein N7491_007871 [Penicillium cf. griseofulvum]|uniref:Wax synthase domain-containing protein n=1 Tax=Penicillium cf. griseofulvum TaxID=2972120 RepID=A0A9W9J6F0_9EURO|nr:hypothetical protein N7472_009100 [Penicillium cf. griseofulvum]KAJ5427429.1 hypothetical protein N7491_007871 [Penicillium cf. griseofulvum]KAJ5431629.1 hypothetical protein N7445_008127 [Penicillium cf. griseofulvum]